jgi:hypothetical protein
LNRGLQIVDALLLTLAELVAAVGKALAPIQQRTRLLTTMRLIDCPRSAFLHNILNANHLPSQLHGPLWQHGAICR